MASSRSTTWLQLAGGTDLTVFAHDRLYRLLHDLPESESQTPRLVHFIGRRHKQAALKHLFPYNNFGRWRNKCFVNLRLETSSSNTHKPLLISDSDTNLDFDHAPYFQYDNAYKEYPIKWLRELSSDIDVNDILQARMIFPFADLLCLFMEDYKEIDSLVRKLLQWSSLRPTYHHSRVLPQLLLITSAQCRRQEFGILDSYLTESFSSIEVFHLGNESLSETARYRRLREKINTTTLSQLEIRESQRLAFTGPHFCALFNKNLEHFAHTTSEPFDIVSATRAFRKHTDMTPHVTNFVRAATRLNIDSSAISNTIAASFFENAYPPRMHVFDWTLLYEFYEFFLLPEVCYALAPSIKATFKSLFEAFVTGTTSLDLRIASQQRCGDALQGLRLNTSCLFCLAFAPEYTLACGHSMCETCVQKYGEGLDGIDNRFLLRGCGICFTNIGKEVLLKPPTAGVRIMSIDGGGTRGAIPLETLSILQNLLGELPLQACFDLAIGTSSGGLIVLALFALYWNADKSSEAFDTLSRKIFGGPKRQASMYEALRKYVRCWLADGAYDHKSLEDCLQTIYGSSAPLFGAPHQGSSSAKYAVTTSTISDGTPFLVANYNGDITRKSQSYEILRPANLDDEPLIWEAARVTSAAPVFFQSYDIANLGGFQDGGIKHNNPSRMAYWESRRLWPESKTPDVFLSLGTGAPDRAPKEKTTHFRNFLIDGFIPRLFRSCMSKSDGELMWNEFIDSLDDTSRTSCYRLNIPLQGLALIDDVNCMDPLRATVRSQPDATREEVVRRLLASCFYLSLDRECVLESGSYLVHGTLRCRVDPLLVAKALRNAGFAEVDFLTDTVTIAQLGCLEDEICSHCHCFRKQVSFYVRSLDETIYIFITSTGFPKLKISGFPQNIQWFEQRQGFRAVFGDESHGTPKRLHCRYCTKDRAKRETTEPHRPVRAKRPCLAMKSKKSYLPSLSEKDVV